ncbi:signal peptidase II [Aeromicrobium sp. Leaf350]|uniref:signal peptidase II n=1 Tax=Aeromicrobium sp. Leaf350 TaxID=2876565 RepID=UPI001E3C9281|nr:signal peptidase II [Aeromicrobium sp. Leaf350]
MQAARGASLSTEAPGGSGAGARGSHRRLLIGFAIGVVAAWAIDQLTKVWAVARLEDGDPIRLVPDVLELRFLRNGGAAFGLGDSMTIVLTLIAIGVAVMVIRLAPRLQDRGWTVALGLLLAGTTGNLTDRLLREPEPLHGHVVDFIDYGGLFVGNVADIYLTVAAVLILWQSWKGVGLDGLTDTQRGAKTLHRASDDDADTDGPSVGDHRGE